MSDERARLRVVHALASAGLAFSFIACEQPKAQGESAEAPQQVDGVMGGQEANTAAAAPAPMLKAMGPSARRVKVIVLPGSASVEVDGTAARRRDGVIELTGKVGEARRLRVMDDTRQLEVDVKIEEGGASPPVVDLGAQPPKGGAP